MRPGGASTPQPAAQRLLPQPPDPLGERAEVLVEPLAQLVLPVAHLVEVAAADRHVEPEEARLLRAEAETTKVSRANSMQKDGMGATSEIAAIGAEHYVPGIEQHLQRISEMAACVAARMGFEPAHCRQIRLASLLHDIGKLGGPTDIYTAERTLTPEEFEQTKGHTSHGADLLKRYQDPVILMARNIALQHHENWDGSGYPEGLKGEEISIEAAIVHAVDIYDNLRAQRPYRRALTHQEAMQVLVEGDDKSTPDHIAPTVLTALLSQHREIEAIYERYKPLVPKSDG